MAHPDADVFQRVILGQHEIGEALSARVEGHSLAEMFSQCFPERSSEVARFGNLQSKVLLIEENGNWFPPIFRGKSNYLHYLGIAN